MNFDSISHLKSTICSIISWKSIDSAASLTNEKGFNPIFLNIPVTTLSKREIAKRKVFLSETTDIASYFRAFPLTIPFVVDYLRAVNEIDLCCLSPKVERYYVFYILNCFLSWLNIYTKNSNMDFLTDLLRGITNYKNDILESAFIDINYIYFANHEFYEFSDIFPIIYNYYVMNSSLNKEAYDILPLHLKVSNTENLSHNIKSVISLCSFILIEQNNNISSDIAKEFYIFISPYLEKFNRNAVYFYFSFSKLLPIEMITEGLNNVLKSIVTHFCEIKPTYVSPKYESKEFIKIDVNPHISFEFSADFCDDDVYYNLNLPVCEIQKNSNFRYFSEAESSYLTIIKNGLKNHSEEIINYFLCNFASILQERKEDEHSKDLMKCFLGFDSLFYLCAEELIKKFIRIFDLEQYKIFAPEITAFNWLSDFEPLNN